MHERGAKLILSSRREEALSKVRQNCPGNRSDIHTLPLDLSEAEAMPAITEEALSHYGRIDYLFNNGGISQRSLANETNMDVVRKVMEVNFFGTVALTKAVLPFMIDRQYGILSVAYQQRG
ncbi:MAG: SDR family NAD(P)-dependent oxidoreductase [Balneolaceae bacterium]|nr:SDR family NAD(P)-dependent oxidoreductase [Balneolaceae bacterium]